MIKISHNIRPMQQHHAMPMPSVGKFVHHQTEPSKFKQVLTNEQSLSITKHAKQRMQERELRLSDTQWQQLHEKTAEARQKGVTDSLVLTHDTALVLSVINNKIITAMDRKEASSQLFTNINGAILLNDKQTGPTWEV